MTDSFRQSIMIPVYRSEGTLPESHRRLVVALEPVERSFEVDLAQGAGDDRSWRAINKLVTGRVHFDGIQTDHGPCLCATTIGAICAGTMREYSDLGRPLRAVR